MSTKTPRTRREVLKYGKKLGGVVVEGGRHTKIYNPDTGRSVSVPRHPGDIPRGTLGSILKNLDAMFFVAVVLLIPACMLAGAILYSCRM